MDEINKYTSNTCKLVIGNKVDVPEKKQVSDEEIKVICMVKLGI
jgi:hypothetical protein